MIPIVRLAEPEVLRQKAAEWLTDFLARRAESPTKRPDSSKYAHREVVEALQAMSGHKCFYCERSLKECGFEVDHYIDPCAPDVQPWEHLTFDDEMIRAKDGSALGSDTIRKYKLDRSDLDHKRGRQLRIFEKRWRMLLERASRERRDLTNDEREVLRSFAAPSQPFSLMFRVYLGREGAV